MTDKSIHASVRKYAGGPQTTEPTTEAGRGLLEFLYPQHGGAMRTDAVAARILAIEAEARTDMSVMDAAYAAGRADALREVGELVELHDQAVLAIRVAALREAAETVRALAAPKYDGNTWTKDCEHGWETHEAAVLAILQPDAEQKP